MRERLARNPILVAPGVYDAFGALLAREAGFTAAMRERMLDFAELDEAIGTPDMIQRGKRYQE